MVKIWHLALFLFAGHVKQDVLSIELAEQQILVMSSFSLTQ
jgi:hypothetical protein